MTKLLALLVLFIFAGTFSAAAQPRFESDTIPTAAGDLKITFLGHGSLMFEFDGKVIHVDPYSKVADYTALPKADLILITHEHRDHLDMKALEPIRTGKTRIVLTELCAKQLPGGTVMKNGDEQKIRGSRSTRCLPTISFTNGTTASPSIRREMETVTSSPSATSGCISPETPRTFRKCRP